MKKLNRSFCMAAVAGAAIAAPALGQSFEVVSGQPGTFTDISGIGMIVSQGDDVSNPFTSSVTNALVTNPNLYASTNGNITDTPFGNFGNTALPVVGPSFGLFPFWDDLYADPATNNGAVLAASVVEAGIPVQIIQWNNVRTYAGGTGSATGTFQVKIFGGGPVLAQYLYQDMSFAANGASATVGVQTPGGASMYSFNTANINNNDVLTVVQSVSGACCVPLYGCQIRTAAQCTAAGGTYQGNNTTCPNGNCPPAPSNITTVFNNNNLGDLGGAVYYDVTVGASPITVTGLATNTDAPGAFTMDVYTVVGGHTAHTGNQGAWTLQSTGNGTGAGVGQPSIVNLGVPVVLAANTTYGVALVMDSTGSHHYTNGDGTNQSFSNADLTLNLGSASNVPFDGLPFFPRVWNGSLFYTLGGTPPVTGSCCLTSGSCVVTTSSNCTGQGGTYRGDNTDCSQACPLPPGLWIEQGDAGETFGAGQVTAGPSTSSALNEIRGALSADADMYQITICDPANFSATTVGGTTFDSQLFLFNAAGNGVSFNDDSTGLQSTLTSMFTAALPAGTFFVAVSTYDNDAVDAGFQELWLDTPFGVERAPDGPGAANPMASYSGGGGSGNYTIALTGACYGSGGSGGCYANCDNSTTAPILNVADFTCFLQRFAAGDSYANCDQSTTAPVLNVADFTCFLQSFAAGCP